MLKTSFPVRAGVKTARTPPVPATITCYWDNSRTRCRRHPWWEDLRAALAPLDQEPTVYLHGDIKSEHLLVDGETVHIVDWEASARGPAARDHAEIMFHLVRDLVYADIGPQRLPGDAIGRVPVTGAVFAWRVVQWLDRRRPGDIETMSLDDLQQLAHAPNSADAVQRLGRFIARSRSYGIPR